MNSLVRFALAACAASMLCTVPAHAATTLRFGHANSPGEVAHDLFAELADRVGKRTNGEVVIRVFPSEQLGKEADLLQQVKSGRARHVGALAARAVLAGARAGNRERPVHLE